MNTRDLEAQLVVLFASEMSPAQRQELDRRLAETDRTQGGRRFVGLRGRRRQTGVLLAATLGMLLIGALGTLSATPPRTPGEIAADRAAEWLIMNDPVLLQAAASCLSPAEATALVRGRLDELGLTKWSIGTRSGAENFRCVTFGPARDMRAVLLFPSMGGDVNSVIEATKVTLMQQCLDQNAAAALITSQLHELGWDRFSVVTGGPVVYPNGQEQAVEDHVVDGCWVFNRAQSRPDGTYLFYLYGR